MKNNNLNNVLTLTQPASTNINTSNSSTKSNNSPSDLYSSIIDSLPDHIAVIDTLGNIQNVNEKWVAFANNNGYPHNDEWQSINYLEVCKKSADNGDLYARDTLEGIQKVIDGVIEKFDLEYPCHSPTEQRWFLMHVTQFVSFGKKNILISHQNISKIALQAKTDSLLKIANRRHFEEFYDQEWKRCMRSQMQLSMAFIDLDHFKAINDTCGHEVGDHCLLLISDIIKKYSKRVSDLCARYGGDEFVVIWGNIDAQKAKCLCEKILQEINELEVDFTHLSSMKHLSVSIGVCSIVPQKDLDKKEFTILTDQRLYQAKLSGRNTICAS